MNNFTPPVPVPRQKAPQGKLPLSMSGKLQQQQKQQKEQQPHLQAPPVAKHAPPVPPKKNVPLPRPPLIHKKLPTRPVAVPLGPEPSAKAPPAPPPSRGRPVPPPVPPKTQRPPLSAPLPPPVLKRTVPPPVPAHTSRPSPQSVLPKCGMSAATQAPMHKTLPAVPPKAQYPSPKTQLVSGPPKCAAPRPQPVRSVATEPITQRPPVHSQKVYNVVPRQLLPPNARVESVVVNKQNVEVVVEVSETVEEVTTEKAVSPKALAVPLPKPASPAAKVLEAPTSLSVSAPSSVPEPHKKESPKKNKPETPKKSATTVHTISISGVTSNVKITGDANETQDDFPCDLMDEPPSGEKGLMNNAKKPDGTKKPQEFSIVKNIYE